MVNVQYQAVIDSEICTMCEDCIERCQVDAINNVDDVIMVNSDKCIGCGLCLPLCPVDAISFVQNPKAQIPSTDLNAYMTAVREERGMM